MVPGVGSRPLWLMLALAVAYWPLWPWFLRRMTDGSDDPWGVVAIAALVALALQGTRARPMGRAGWAGLCGLVGLYALTWGQIPVLASAALACASLGLVVSVWRFGGPWNPSVWALATLGLPWMASLQFFLGYPLRAWTSWAAALWLRLSGVGVVSDGALLKYGSTVISVDGPCSGVKMLWAGALLWALVASARRLRLAASLGLGVGVFVGVMFANVVRAAGVFYVEAGLFDGPTWMHEGVGWVVFALVCVGVWWGSSHVESMPMATPSVEGADSRVWPLLTSLMMLMALGAPMLPRAEVSAVPAPAFPGFPEAFEGAPLRALEMTAREERVLGRFPGRVGRFQAGSKTVVARWVHRATRQLHPASDCYRGLGYETRPMTPWRDAQGRMWSRFEARRGQETLEVREIVEGPSGRTYSDASQWYWSALGGAPGPWWAWTVALPAAQATDGHNAASGH